MISLVVVIVTTSINSRPEGRNSSKQELGKRRQKAEWRTVREEGVTKQKAEKRQRKSTKC